VLWCAVACERRHRCFATASATCALRIWTLPPSTSCANIRSTRSVEQPLHCACTAAFSHSFHSHFRHSFPPTFPCTPVPARAAFRPVAAHTLSFPCARPLFLLAGAIIPRERVTDSPLASSPLASAMPRALRCLCLRVPAPALMSTSSLLTVGCWHCSHQHCIADSESECRICAPHHRHVREIQESLSDKAAQHEQFYLEVCASLAVCVCPCARARAHVCACACACVCVRVTLACGSGCLVRHVLVSLVCVCVCCAALRLVADGLRNLSLAWALV
jgi:hypothetical protein